MMKGYDDNQKSLYDYLHSHLCRADLPSLHINKTLPQNNSLPQYERQCARLLSLLYDLSASELLTKNDEKRLRLY